MDQLVWRGQIVIYAFSYPLIGEYDLVFSLHGLSKQKKRGGRFLKFIGYMIQGAADNGICRRGIEK
jgi:hypothetical protein